MNVLQMIEGEQSIPKGGVAQGRSGKMADQVMSQLMPKYYELMRKGRVFIGATTYAGVAIPVYTATTAVVFMLWNQSIDRDCVPLVLLVGNVGTPAVSGSIGLSIVSAGYQIGTGAPVSAFTKTNPRNAYTMLAVSDQAGQFSLAATIVNPANFMTLGLTSVGVVKAAADVVPWVYMRHDFDGLVNVPPGIGIHVCGDVAQTAAYNLTLYWAEVPIS